MANEQNGCLPLFGWLLIGAAVLSFANGSPGLGVVLLIGGVVVLCAGNGKAAATGGGPPPLPSTVALRVGSRSETFEGFPLELVTFLVRGTFSSQRRIVRPMLEIRMHDVTDGGVPSPLLCVIDSLQDSKSTEFRFAQNFPKPLEIGAGAADWLEIGAVPKETLIFPYQGRRNIRVEFRVFDLAGGVLVATTQAMWMTSAGGGGYLEMEVHESAAQAASLKLAMAVAAADGTVDDSEVNVIKEWGQRSVNALPEARQPDRREILNTALKEATQFIRDGKIAELEQGAFAVLHENDEVRLRYDAYELCLQIIKADGEAHPLEIAKLTGISKRLGLDEKKIRILSDRHLAKVEFITDGAETDQDHFLGITPDMSSEDIRKHLNKLFNKHQARSTHDDPKVAQAAKDWLKRIADARVRHLSGGP